MAGGTGGHIFPGIAIGRAVQQQFHDIEVLWLGSKGGMETQIIPHQTNFSLYLLNIKGFRKKTFLQKLIVPFLLLRSIWNAIKIFKQEKPDIVLGMGGFVCAPGGIAAKLLHIPLFIHEQNSVAGLTNKLLSLLSQKIFTGFPTVLKLSFSHKKMIFTGNPVRKEILNIPAKTQLHNPIRLLIVGGSRGAAILNDLIPKALQLIPNEFNIEVFHQTGKDLTSDYSNAHSNISAKTQSFIDDMAKIYDWADIIICRSGALTLAEITAIGIPAILIPYPFAVDNHQTFNAKYLSNNNAAILSPQSELTAEILLEQLIPLFQTENYIKMAQASRALRRENTISMILDSMLT